MVNRDIVSAKLIHVQQILDRLKEKQAVGRQVFSDQKDLQDIVLFNLQVAIQGCVDIASHIVSDHSWGVPQSLADLFNILYKKKVITSKTRDTMRAMAGFRNIVVHEYKEIDMNLVYGILTKRLSDFNIFLKEVSNYAKL